MAGKIGRREVLGVAGGALSLLLGRGRLLGQDGGGQAAVEVRLINVYRTGGWYFDPVGIHLQPGQKVRWICTKWGGTVTAYHPSNRNRELRIPEGARPFDSGTLLQGDTERARFEWTFQEEGTYDYFSYRHERLGAVGRIVVGTPGGPATKPMGYGMAENRAPTYQDARKLLDWLTPDRILQEKQVRFPGGLLDRTFPVQDSPF